jgi:hypothetical protein
VANRVLPGATVSPDRSAPGQGSGCAFQENRRALLAGNLDGSTPFNPGFPDGAGRAEDEAVMPADFGLERSFSRLLDVLN